MIGHLIKAKRIEKAISMSELAERANVSKSYLSTLERNVKTNPTIDVVMRIAEVLDVKAYELLGPALKRNIQEEDMKNELISQSNITDFDNEQLSDYEELIEFIKWRNRKKDSSDKN